MSKLGGAIFFSQKFVESWVHIFTPLFKGFDGVPQCLYNIFLTPSFPVLQSAKVSDVADRMIAAKPPALWSQWPSMWSAST